MGEFFRADCKSLLQQFTHQEMQLNLKRRWLAGLPLSKEQLREFKGLTSQNESTIPESLLREDDAYYETIKSFVENRLGQRNTVSREKLVKLQHFQSSDDKKTILYLLDDMTNIALCNLAEMLIGESMKFRKTRRKMKKTIKEFLPKMLDEKNGNYNVNIKRQISQFLTDPQNFRSESYQSHRDAVSEILDRLEDFPTPALSAMHRRLIGTKGYVPQLKARQGLRRDLLIQKVRESSIEMLTDFDESDDELLQEPLAEAMSVGSLTLKLILGCDIVSNFEFKRVSPDVEFFQNEVARALCSLNQKGKFEDVKNLQVVLDPNAKLSNKKLVLAAKRLLTEYLFECDDLQNMPRWLLETLAIVNKTSQSISRTEGMQETRSISRDVEDEVECILTVSALTRQVAWDLCPDSQLDCDFSDAYMGDLEESDDEVECSMNDGGYCADWSKEQTESVGEVSNNPKTEKDFCSPFLESNGRLAMEDAEMDAVDSYPSPSSCVDSKDDIIGSYTANLSVHGKLKKNYAECPEPSIDSNNSHDSGTYDIKCGEVNGIHDEQQVTKNKYLTIQEASDETSMVAYRLIGSLLNNFARRDGLDLDDDAVTYLGDTSEITSSKGDDTESIIFQAVEELIPSFPKYGRERLKHLFGLNPN